MLELAGFTDTTPFSSEGIVGCYSMLSCLPKAFHPIPIPFFISFNLGLGLLLDIHSLSCLLSYHHLLYIHLLSAFFLHIFRLLSDSLCVFPRKCFVSFIQNHFERLYYYYCNLPVFSFFVPIPLLTSLSDACSRQGVNKFRGTVT